MPKYIYNGPVKVFDQIVNEHWYGETMATTPKKAKSNLAYQYKRQHGLATATKIHITGDVEEV